MRNAVVNYVLLLASLIKVSFCLCSNGIIENGVSSKDILEIIGKHNEVRHLVAKGELPRQPRSVKMPNLQWDKALAEEAQKISDTCNYGHVPVNDDRWYVGQNIYLLQSTNFESGSNWTSAIQTWIDEYKIYNYPKFNFDVGHYTQIVWSATKYVGCGYTSYQSPVNFWYQKYYVCNYGPGGNVIGKAPYETI